MSTEAQSQNETRLPRAVRERITRLNTRLEPKPAEPSETPPVAEAPPADPPASVVTEPVTSPAPAAPADPRESDPAYWRQRFNVTHGMLRQQRAEFEQRDAQREQELAELREKVRSLETAKAPDQPDLATMFTPEQIAQFGEEQCQAMATAAVTAARAQAQQLIDAQVKPLQDQRVADAKRAKANAMQDFTEKLAELVPDYQEVDKDPAWLAWLDEDDDATGIRRQDILDRHIAAQNAQRVAGMFTAFQATRAPRPTPPVAPPRNAPGGGVNEPTPPAKGYPTPQEIRDFGKRASTIRNPRDPRYVTDKERAEFEARLRLRNAA